jgi:hypothetical protein
VTGEAVVVAAHVRRLEARWVTPIGALTVAEPDGDVLAAASDALAAFYNEPHNAALLSNTLIFSPDDVLQFWADSAAEGGHSFLLRCDEELVGDADFRNVTVGAAEVAILIGVRGRQGQGLGGRFLSMVLAIGFGPLVRRGGRRRLPGARARWIRHARGGSAPGDRARVDVRQACVIQRACSGSIPSPSSMAARFSSWTRRARCSVARR